MNNLKAIYRNLLNKIPKLLLLIVVLYALALNKEMLFGSTIAANEPPMVVVQEDMIHEFYGAGVSILTLDSVVYEVRTAATDTDPVGYVISSAAYSHRFRGFGGRTPVAIFLDEGMIIRGVKLLENQESGRFVERMEQGGFFDSWNGHHLYDPLPDIDAFSGATYTSRSVIANVDETFTKLLDIMPAPFSWTNFASRYAGEFAILLVVALCFVCFIFPSATHRWRVPLLLLSIGVLGIWQGAFVSLDLLYKWLIYGTSPAARLGIFAIVLMSILLPLMVNKAFYCTFVCPFGAAQELLGKIGARVATNGRIWKISPKVVAISLWVRRLFLVLMVGLLLWNPRFDLAEFEPFTIFLIHSAALSAVILAVLSLIMSLFTRRPWCRLLCPTGEILSILRRPLIYPLKFKQILHNGKNNQRPTGATDPRRVCRQAKDGAGCGSGQHTQR